MKKSIFLLLLIFCTTLTQAQFLKKLKEKVNAAVDKTSGAKSDKQDVKNCSDDTLCSIIFSGNDGIGGTSFKNVQLDYSESCLSFGTNGKKYRLHLTGYSTGTKKEAHIYLEEGKVAEYFGQTKDDFYTCKNAVEKESNSGLFQYDKYIIKDSIIHPIAGAKGQTIEIKSQNKITNTQMSQAQAFAEAYKNSAEYKKMSAKEREEYEEALKMMPGMMGMANAGIDANNAMAGTKISTPDVAATSYTTYSYTVKVGGRTFGKFSTKPLVFVSADEKNVFVWGYDDNGLINVSANGKKLTITNPAFNLNITPTMLVSNDGQKMVVIGTQDYNSFSILQFSGAIVEVKNNFDNASDISANFHLANNGDIIWLKQSSFTVYANDKAVGSFDIKDKDMKPAFLVGTSALQSCAYDDSGNLYFLNGKKIKAGILPSLITENGVTYIRWFSLCNNNVYLCKTKMESK